MGNEIVLSPEALFFLGQWMQAEYIDYDYIAMLRDLGRDYSRIQRRCLQELSGEKLVRQQITGEVSVRPQLERLLKNVFFGKLETSLDVFSKLEGGSRETYRFHYLDGTVTLVRQEQKRLYLSAAEPEDMERIIRTAVGRHREASRKIHHLDENALGRMLLVKRAEVDRGSTSTLLFEQDGVLYASYQQGAVSVSDTQAREILATMLKGE